MLHIILYAIIPILVVMAAGYISGKKGVFSAKDGKAFNKVVLDFALPAALFVSIVDADRKMLVSDQHCSHLASGFVHVYQYKIQNCQIQITVMRNLI